MLYKGIISEKGVILTKEPARINDRTHFKIWDHGNLQHFPIGSLVNFTLTKSPTDGAKIASIHSLVEVNSYLETEIGAEVVMLDEYKQKKNSSDIDMVDSPLHFYLVFNPMFNSKIEEEIEGATQAHSFYNLLAKKMTLNKESYLYWGKLKSSDFNDPLRMDYFPEVIAKNTSKKIVTNLYISDFHFFWCAKVSEVNFMLDFEKENMNTLNFYKQNWDRIEAWFKITDMKLLSNTAADTNNLISNLIISPKNKLNSRQDERTTLQVTPYLSGLRYPLIIEDVRSEAYFEFDQTEKAISEKNVLLKNSEGETNKTKSIVYSYVIPEKIFSRFSHQVQNQILSAEVEYLKCEGTTKEDLYQTDFSVATKYLIALERCFNDVIKQTQAPIDSCFSEWVTLGQLQFALMKNQHSYMKKNYPQLFEFLTDIRGDLYKWTKIRNKEFVHLGNSKLDTESLKNVRRIILGVGTKGVLVRLYQATFKELRDIHEIIIPGEEKKRRQA